ncbi:MAG: 50S ribosomal protein L29 [Planctomycetes bacterium]|jgi:large subunit ribosomal protein L29|nr:50S ribosomal protein L29 [Planctomycetota bacterium]MBT4028267.1 50S ribosomal protein L29 [Planctomycetota bacterium]MBT4560940.1 50S ribosomal protein L29 [Planctomycetota bacterium]MBT5101315.1 50S ribosomal protein L29 [Planctomycetota bacterium]MBT5120679.1 50S ribosomal protein L29 [Planctomycetota bacterium]
MKVKEVRGKENEEIFFDLANLEKELFEMNFRQLTEGNASPAKIRLVRRDIARMKTILREREIGIRGQEAR